MVEFDERGTTRYTIGSNQLHVLGIIIIFMKQSLHNPILVGVANAVGTLVYITLIALALSHGQNIFGKGPNILGGVAFLLLFVLSAIIVSLLVLGRPVYLLVNNAKEAAVRMLFSTVGSLIVVAVGIILFTLYFRS